MEDSVRIEQTFMTNMGPVRTYSRITKEAYEEMSRLIDQDPRPVSNDRLNEIIAEATKKYPMK